ncbi:flagellin FliC, partial [Verticiella sediminum]
STNYLSLVAQNNLNKSQSQLGTAIERLSSGMRINSAKDDAAGQAIANRFTANVKGLTQATRNANDGISIAQTTEGSLNEINANLQRIRELSVQAANGSNSDTDLQSIQNEITERLDEIDRVSRETQFNGKYILGDDAASLSVQVGAHDGQRIDINLTRIDSQTLGLSGFNVDGSAKVANAAATKANLEAKVPGGTWNADETVYTAVPENAGATGADVFAQLKDGNTVTRDVGGTPTTFRYSEASKSFAFDVTETSTEADVQTTVTADGATTGKITVDGVEVDVNIAADGKLSTLNGEALYINGDELTVTNVGGGNQATVEDVLADEAFGAGNNATLVVDGKSYENDGDDVVVSYEDTISAEDLLAEITANTTAGTEYTVDLGALYGGVYDLGENGESAAVAGATVYLDDTGNFTNEQFGAETTYGLSADGVVTNANGDQLYVGEDGALTTEADHAGDRTANPLAALDAALQKVDDLRSHLGAI